MFVSPWDTEITIILESLGFPCSSGNEFALCSLIYKKLKYDSNLHIFNFEH